MRGLVNLKTADTAAGSACSEAGSSHPGFGPGNLRCPSCPWDFWHHGLHIYSQHNLEETQGPMKCLHFLPLSKDAKGTQDEKTHG